MANLRGMHENHIRILPSVEEMYLFTDTPSNYSPCALHTILNTSVLKPEGSDILWILYMEPILYFSESQFGHRFLLLQTRP